MKNDNDVPRPVRLSDFLVIIAGFAQNIARAVTVLFEDLFELSVYYSNRKTKENMMWQKASIDLETLPEE